MSVMRKSGYRFFRAQSRDHKQMNADFLARLGVAQLALAALLPIFLFLTFPSE